MDRQWIEVTSEGPPYAWNESGTLDLSPWLAQLLCSQRMSAVIGVCDNGMSLGKGKFLEKAFVIHWGWAQRGKGDFIRSSATGLGMKLGPEVKLKEQKQRWRSVVSLAVLHSRLALWLSNLLELGPSTKQWVKKAKLEGRSVWATGDENGR